MFPKYHIITGAIFTLIVLLLFPQIGLIAASLIFLSSFLIDVDHYLYYAFKKNDWSLKNSFNWFMGIHKRGWMPNFRQEHKDKNIKAPFSFLHTIEFLIFLGALSLFSQPLLFVFLGFIFHSFADVLDLYIRRDLDLREFSTILYLIRRNKKEWIYL